MKFSISFLEHAEQELLDAVAYYNEQTAGLGFEFVIEVQKANERIIKYPDAWSPLSKKTRKCHCNRFPYNIVYFMYDYSIINVAIMHTKRKPNYWVKRIDTN